ncbi:MAG: hypothetical protein N3E47_05865 [Candidatus Bathyarchaeota archaeon]|nr:hypothetical protein [Candidatus Bathyarchaeota archaeon]
MSFVKILADLNLEVASLKHRRKILKTLLDEGKVSQRAFGILDGMAAEIESAVINLKEKIEGSIKFWEAMASEETRILESLLVDLRFKSLVGDLDEENWRILSTIIGLGIGSTSALANKIAKSIENDVNLKANILSRKRRGKANSNLSRRNRELGEREGKFSKSIPEPESRDGSYCMNQWKPG